jgi:hypothetical protein
MHAELHLRTLKHAHADTHARRHARGHAGMHARTRARCQVRLQWRRNLRLRTVPAAPRSDATRAGMGARRRRHARARPRRAPTRASACAFTMRAAAVVHESVPCAACVAFAVQRSRSAPRTAKDARRVILSSSPRTRARAPPPSRTGRTAAVGRTRTTRPDASGTVPPAACTTTRTCLARSTPTHSWSAPVRPDPRTAAARTMGSAPMAHGLCEHTCMPCRAPRVGLGLCACPSVCVCALMRSRSHVRRAQCGSHGLTHSTVHAHARAFDDLGRGGCGAVGW